jgi:spore germination cell wall hydrolase CwlJ-like protein
MFKVSEREFELVAKTIYGEARGEYKLATGGLSSLIAVGNVICNRVLKKSWYGHTIEQVCLKPWQFSCWNKNDPNYKILMQESINDSLYDLCQEVSQGVLTHWPDLTKGATHYHTVGIPLPNWAKGTRAHTKIGQHLFYTLD